LTAHGIHTAGRKKQKGRNRTLCGAGKDPVLRGGEKTRHAHVSIARRGERQGRDVKKFKRRGGEKGEHLVHAPESLSKPGEEKKKVHDLNDVSFMTGKIEKRESGYESDKYLFLKKKSGENMTQLP